MELAALFQFAGVGCLVGVVSPEALQPRKHMELAISSLFIVLAGMAYDRNAIGTMIACIIVAVLSMLSIWIDKLASTKSPASE